MVALLLYPPAVTAIMPLWPITFKDTSFSPPLGSGVALGSGVTLGACEGVAVTSDVGSGEAVALLMICTGVGTFKNTLSPQMAASKAVNTCATAI